MLLVAKRLGYVYAVNMASNDNSVNIKLAKRSYHHGDLRTSAVNEGLRLLQSNDAESLSLREVARGIGVSATAIYRHFPDKNSLLAALAAAGYAQLGELQLAASKPGGAEGFAASGRAYVRFALGNPALFRLMFASLPMNTHPSEEAPWGSPAWILHRSVSESLPANATSEVAFAAMLRAWSLVHGLAMLILDKQVDQNEAESLIDKIISSDGLRI